MRKTIGLVLLAAAVLGDDGGSAPPERWTHPHGSAACNGFSVARPPESFGGIVWSYRAKTEIAAPPLTWDGAVFVLDGPTLVALDATTGKPWARTPVKDAGPPAVFARSVYLVEGADNDKLVQHQLAGDAFHRGWTYDTGPGASAPRILDGEIYVTTPKALLSLRSGEPSPTWSVAGAYVGAPAVRDGHVYALRRDAGQLRLSAYARRDGSEAASVTVAKDAPAGDSAMIVLGGHVAAARLPGGNEWVLFKRSFKNGRLVLVAGRRETLLSVPFAGTSLLVAITEEPPAMSWLTFRGGHARRPFVWAKRRPDLFAGAAGCVWLGEASQCFGTWIGDVNGNRIFWRLAETPAGKSFPDGVRFHAVPAFHEHLLLVPKDGKSLHLIGPERLQ